MPNCAFRRDVADVAGLTTYVFGVEDVDRHVMVFKKEYPLTEEELEAYKNGEEWDPEKFKEEARLVSNSVLVIVVNNVGGNSSFCIRGILLH